MLGVSAHDVYIPRARLSKKAIAEANAWFDASLNSLAKGERAICNWDEDVITMAVEAAKNCLASSNASVIKSLYLASTTFPFTDRQNSVVVGEALNLESSIRAMDIGASQRAATSSLVSLLESGTEGDSLLVSSEHRKSKAGSRSEMLWGDAAAALLLSRKNVIAECVAIETLAVDFVDHYRGEESDFDYDWEERWIRDEGYLKTIPLTVKKLIKKANINVEQIKHFVLPSDQARTPGAVAKNIGITQEAIVDNQMASVGVAGAAQPIVLFSKALEIAAPEEYILLLGFGQGCDALLFKTTDKIAKYKPSTGAEKAIANRREETNYNKFLSFNGLIEKDFGKRGEVDKQTYLSGYNRRKDLLTGFIGGKCRVCGTVQIPREKYCVNPECHALDSQDDYCFSDKFGTVATWTADRLTFDWNPPAYFGMVQFDGGGKIMMDFTEVEEGKIDTGSRVSVHFRVRQFDSVRGFRKYFWKAVVED